MTENVNTLASWKSWFYPSKTWQEQVPVKKRDVSHHGMILLSPLDNLQCCWSREEETTIPILWAAIKNFRGLHSTLKCWEELPSCYQADSEEFLPAFSTMSWEVGTGPHVEVLWAPWLAPTASPWTPPAEGISRPERQQTFSLECWRRKRFWKISQPESLRFSTLPEDQSLFRQNWFNFLWARLSLVQKQNSQVSVKTWNKKTKRTSRFLSSSFRFLIFQPTHPLPSPLLLP